MRWRIGGTASVNAYRRWPRISRKKHLLLGAYSVLRHLPRRAATTSLLALLVAPAAVRAAPAIDPDTGRPVPAPARIAADPSNPQHKAAIEYYMKQFGVAEQTAIDHLNAQNRVPDAGQRLAARLGSGFTHMFFDNTAGRYVVQFGPGGTAAKARQAAEDIGMGAVSTQERPYSRGQLMTDLETVGERMSGTAGALLSETKDGIVVALPANASQAARSRLSSARDAVRTPVIERTAPPRPPEQTLACWNRYCDALIAGDRYVKADSSFCTLSFHVGLISDPSRHFLLSAGHCVPPEQGNQIWGSCRPWVDACTNMPGAPSTFAYPNWNYAVPAGGRLGVRLAKWISRQRCSCA